jgi:hypothetical protein
MLRFQPLSVGFKVSDINFNSINLPCRWKGSGKSHTVSVMLENMFVSKCTSIGSLKKPLSGLVLHFGGSGSSSLPCEAAWLSTTKRLGVTPPTVRVFVSRSSLKTMRAVYAPLGQRVTVEPLYFSEAELDAQAFLSMMAVGSSESAPLYIQTVLVRRTTALHSVWTDTHPDNFAYLGRELHLSSIYEGAGRFQKGL